jgi:hypothetical protein
LDTGGFTEFVPLAFIPYRNRLGQRLAREYRDPDFRRLERMTREKAERLYPICRLFFGQLIPNLQTSWVKLGLAQAIESLEWGCNDFGGTLYEESITRASGGPHGECLEPGIIEESLRRAGKTPARRTTLYHYAESYSLADYSAPEDRAIFHDLALKVRRKFLSASSGRGKHQFAIRTCRVFHPFFLNAQAGKKGTTRNFGKENFNG